MSENEPYTPTTQQVRDAVLMSGKPFDQIVEIDDPVEGYSIHDQYVEPGAAFARWLTQHDAEVLTAARPRLVAESREALVTGLMAARWPEHAGGGLFDMDEETIGWLADALIASGVVTLANPAETDEVAAHEEWRYNVALGFALRTLNEEQGIAFMRAWEENLPASRPAPVASQGDTPAAEEWVSTVEELDALPQDSIVGTTVAWKARNKAETYGGGRFWTGAANDRVATKESHQMTLPIRVLYRPRTREQYEADQKPAVPVDALGFPTEVGATFTAIPLDDRNETRRRFVVGNDGFDVTQAGIRYLRSDLDPASIEDMHPADGRNGQ